MRITQAVFAGFVGILLIGMVLSLIALLFVMPWKLTLGVAAFAFLMYCIQTEIERDE